MCLIQYSGESYDRNDSERNGTLLSAREILPIPMKPSKY